MGFVDNEIIVWLIFDLLIEFIFWVDIVISFFSAYLDSQGNVVRIRKKIKIDKISFGFWCDYVSVIKNIIAFHAVASSKNNRYLIIKNYRMGRSHSRTQKYKQAK